MSQLVIENNKSLIIGLCGTSGSGKDYIAKNYIKEYFNKFNPIILSFADTLKIRAIVEDNLPREKVYIKKDFETRRFLQKKGTELGRNKFGEDIWIKYLHQNILNYIDRDYNVFIITDVRFENERNYIKNNGGYIIGIYAPVRSMNRAIEECNGDEKKIEEVKSHPSEGNIKSDYTVLNDIGAKYNFNSLLYFLEEIDRNWEK